MSTSAQCTPVRVRGEWAQTAFSAEFRETPMKWLWLGFAIVWAISVVLDERRRNHAHRVAATGADSPAPPEKAAARALPAAKILS
jgi:hypothetical protein